MGQTRAQANRAIRQEALRDQLQAQGHVQHIVDICNELNDLNKELSGLDVQRKKTVIDTKLKLLNKYLPDLKNVELANDGGGQLTINLVEYSDE